VPIRVAHPFDLMRTEVTAAMWEECRWTLAGGAPDDASAWDYRCAFDRPA